MIPLFHGALSSKIQYQV